MVEGDLVDLTLRGLLTLLSQEGSTAVLRLQHGDDQGALYFREGTLVHALAGRTSGDQAVQQLLGWSGGRFRLVHDADNQPRTITRPLVELLRPVDRPAPNGTRRGAKDASDGPSADGLLLHELLTLLTRLEQDRTRLAEGRVQQGVPALIVVTAAVNSLVAFATARCSDQNILPSRVLAKLAETLPYTQLLGEEQERVTVTTAAAVIKDWKGNSADRRRMFEDLSRALIDVLDLYCQTIATFFSQPREREEWRATYELFVADMRTAVQQISA